MANHRFETTHVGSLPRSMELARMLIALDHHEEVDMVTFDALVSAEVAGAVQKQADAGVSIVSDGELCTGVPRRLVREAHFARHLTSRGTFTPSARGGAAYFRFTLRF